MAIAEANYYSSHHGDVSGLQAVDPGAQNYTYQGSGEGYFGRQQQGVANRQAPVTNYANANADRAQQMQALGLANAAAQGNVPSVAQQQMYAANNGSIASAAAAAANGRAALGFGSQASKGGGGGGGGQLGAQEALAGAYGQNNMQGSMGRAGEIANARNAYFSGALGVGGQDIAQQQYNAQLAQQQMAANNKYGLSLLGMGQNASVEQQKLNEAYNNQLIANNTDAGQNVIDTYGTQGALDEQRKQNQAQIVKGIYGAAGSAAAALI